MKVRLTILLSGFLLFVLGFFVLGAVPHVAAQSGASNEISGEHVSRLDTEIIIQESGVLDIQERILYDFGDDQRHGIFRDIPFIKEVTDSETGDTKRYKMNINVLSVTDENGNPYMFAESIVGDNINLKIGDPNATITGKNTYVISYTVAGGLEYFSDHDELYWNVVGPEWGVPIAEAYAVVRLEPLEGNANSDAMWDTTRTRCFVGAFGSTSENCIAASSQPEVVYSTNDVLPANSAFTVVFGFPIGLVQELPAELVVDFFDTIQGKIVAALLAIVGSFWYVVYPIWIAVKWYKYGRDPDVGPAVTSYFDPPKTKDGRPLVPAEAGTLVDEVVHVQDFTATLVDLARRGHFVIDEREKKKLYLVKNDKVDEDISKLPNFELKILTEIFDSKTEVKVQDLKLYSILPDVSKKMYDSLTDHGFFPENPESIRKFYGIMTGVATMSFNLPLILSSALFGRAMPKKTLFGAKESQKANGLKNFLKSQEHKLEFEAKEYFKLKDTQTMFEKLLPYAIAFGVEKVWMDRFKDVTLKQPDWYRTYRSDTFNSALLAKSMNNSFKSIRSSATPTRSSTGASSGFSGGGFSGGGGGGGGGGSW